MQAIRILGFWAGLVGIPALAWVVRRTRGPAAWFAFLACYVLAVVSFSSYVSGGAGRDYGTIRTHALSASLAYIAIWTAPWAWWARRGRVPRLSDRSR